MNGNINFAASQGTENPILNEGEEKSLGEEETEFEEEAEDMFQTHYNVIKSN